MTARNGDDAVERHCPDMLFRTWGNAIFRPSAWWVWRPRRIARNGISANRKVTKGWNPLIGAVRDGESELLLVLLEKGASANHATNDGRTPLHYACSSGRKDLVGVLLQYGARINQKDENGETPLFIACKYGTIDVLVLLLDKGAIAVINQPNSEGILPLDIATEKGHKQAAQLLLDRGANTIGSKGMVKQPWFEEEYYRNQASKPRGRRLGSFAMFCFVARASVGCSKRPMLDEKGLNELSNLKRVEGETLKGRSTILADYTVHARDSDGAPVVLRYKKLSWAELKNENLRSPLISGRLKLIDIASQKVIPSPPFKA